MGLIARGVSLIAYALMATGIGPISAHAQVRCTMPNGAVISLMNAKACPAGALKEEKLPEGAQPWRPSPITGPAHTAPKQSAPPAPPVEARTPGTMLIKKGGAIGCKNREQLERLSSISASGDSIALNRAIATAMRRSECTHFPRRTVVYLEDTALFSGLMRVRARGDIDSHWIPMAAAE